MIARHQPSLSKALLAGGFAGLAGACAMSGFTRLWIALAPEPARSKNKARCLPYSEQERDATFRIADIVGRRLFDRRLNEREKCKGAVIVHYAVGATTGAGYAILAKRFHQVRKFSGVMFGVAVWLLADELLMPATGSTRKLRDYSWLAQANALGEHIIYATTADALLRLASQLPG